MNNTSFMFRTATIAAVATLVLTILPWRAGAVSNQLTAEPTHVAIVDPNRVLNSIKEKTVREKDLQVRAKPFLDDLVGVEKEIEMLREKYLTLPEDSDERVDIEFRLRGLLARHKAQADSLVRLSDEFAAQSVVILYQKIIVATEKVAAAEGYDLVFVDDSEMSFKDARNMQEVQKTISSRRLLFATDSVDITGLVITRMNNDFNALNK